MLAWNENSEQLKLAKSLNVKYLNYFKLIELPMLRSIIPSTYVSFFDMYIKLFSCINSLVQILLR